MKDIKEMLYIREILSPVMVWTERPICHQDLLLATGVNPNGEVMTKIIHLKGNLDDFRGLIMNLIIRSTGIVKSACTKNMINFRMTIPALKIMLIEDMINLPGLQEMTVMIMHMMIMATSRVFLTTAGRIAMRGIMIMVGIVMILIMIEAIEEIVIGGNVNHENEIRKALVGKEI